MTERKPQQSQNEVRAARRERPETIPPGESWTSVVAEAMKNGKEEFIFEPEDPTSKTKLEIPVQKPRKKKAPDFSNSVVMKVGEALANSEKGLFVPGLADDKVWD